ncbi:leucyl-tRNA synthetase [Anaerolineae bacterium]|nr:leucyl-tRNA synthetase [Anaerolineae bacterium]
MATKKPTTKRTTKAKSAPRKVTTSRKPTARRAATTRAKPTKQLAHQSMIQPNKYIPQQIESKWQTRWENEKLWHTDLSDARKKYYFLTMYPYPSGDLHIGHWYAMAPSDVKARFLRMNGYNVFFPIGFDAFGLPAENAAIKRKIHPHTWTMNNIANMRRQLRSMGASFDWEREVVTCDPRYYRWNQWFFTQMFKRGLAYKKMAAVDWCPNCKTVLAREQVIGEDRRCERCDTPVTKKDLEQWFLKITAYADELLDFSNIEWPERVKTLQTNWIGRSEGAQFTMRVADSDTKFDVFTTRQDTVFGMTFAVLAPEHALVEKITTPAQRNAVTAYVAKTRRETEIDRLSTEKVRDGVFTGAYAINPMNNDRVPIWIADYVLTTYGTGAIMGVPAHDARDFDFALNYGLPILPVIDRPDQRTKSFALGGTMNDGFADALRAEQIPFEEKQGSLYVTIPPEKIDRYIALAKQFVRADAWNEVVGTRWQFIFHDKVVTLDSLASEQTILAHCHTLEPDVRGKRSVMEMLSAVEFYRDVLYHDEYGTMIFSGEFTGATADVARPRVAQAMEARGIGKRAINYRIRDWLISRQRYWGTPIPIVYCPEHGAQPVPDDQLPVELPIEGVEFMPTGESPLFKHKEFLKAKCPVCGKDARRETDTMDTFIDSSWYPFAYLDPYNTERPINSELTKAWMPVDQYTGGVEHATMHLLYTRFWIKVMRDIGLIDFGEPMTRLFNQGTILAPRVEGQKLAKMSKSKGNVISPDDLVASYSADTVRIYLMFIGPWDQGGPWDGSGMDGVHRWLQRVWTLVTAPLREFADEPNADAEKELRRTTHQIIKRVTEELIAFKFNTTVAALMEFTNYLQKARETAVVKSPAWREAIEALLLMLAPAAPHITEELWERIGKPYSIHQQAWLQWDPKIAADEMFTLIAQVNGKVRDRIELPVGVSETDAKSAALNSPSVQRHLDGKTLAQVIYVPGRLVNIVVK